MAKSRDIKEYVRENQAARRKRLKDEGYRIVLIEIPPGLAESLQKMADEEHRKLAPHIIHLLYKMAEKKNT